MNVYTRYTGRVSGCTDKECTSVYRKASKAILFRKRIKCQNLLKKVTETYVPNSAVKVKLNTERRD